ncbi:hypothetical protein [Pendulispora albinea]|uniref:NHL repeat-containing protein n=1 Tax=Pendulispora albinea TaxID=2741071 RepID=A0ABZ2M3Q3_9BACT
MRTIRAIRFLMLSNLVLASCSDGSGARSDSTVASSRSKALSAHAADETELAVLAGGIGGRGNADGTGAEARFYEPVGMAFDGAGNVYVADDANNVVRKIVLATGEVSTIAGSSWDPPGSADGVGQAARLDGPRGVAADGAGNLYVSDGHNSTIRKIVLATGEVSTFAGAAREPGYADGIGRAARFHGVDGLAIDTSGNLYVSEMLNHTIRKIVLATAEVSTFAGSAGNHGSADGVGSAARFYGADGLAIDTSGNLYVADSYNDTIRKIVIATRKVTTLAGAAGKSGRTNGIGSAARFSEPSGLAIDPSGRLFVTEHWNGQVRSIDLGTARVSTFAGSGDDAVVDGTGRGASFGWPHGIVADGSGHLYVTENRHHAVRTISVASAEVTTFAGRPTTEGHADGVGPAARFFESNAMVADGAGNVYIADTMNEVIRKMVLATGEVTTIAGSPKRTGAADGTGANARFYSPEGIALDGGNLYVADAFNNTIRKIDLATNAVVTIAGSPDYGGSVDGIGLQARFAHPHAIVNDGSGHLYVTDSFGDTVRAIDIATVQVTTLAGTAGQYGSQDGIGPQARFNWINGLAADLAGHLYVSDRENHTIRKIDIATAAVSTLAGSPGEHELVDGVGGAARFRRPAELTIDASGRLFVADEENSAIRAIDPATASVSTLAGQRGARKVRLGTLPTTLNHPRALLALGDGQLLFTDENAILTVRTKTAP